MGRRASHSQVGCRAAHRGRASHLISKRSLGIIGLLRSARGTSVSRGFLPSLALLPERTCVRSTPGGAVSPWLLKAGAVPDRVARQNARRKSPGAARPGLRSLARDLSKASHPPERALASSARSHVLRPGLPWQGLGTASGAGRQKTPFFLLLGRPPSFILSGYRTARWGDCSFPSLGVPSMPRTSRAARFHPSVEFLEHRCVPATITPTTFADGGLGSGSLRDAVLQFNADTGTADDTIQLLPGTYSLTIRNVNGRHETAGLTGDLNLTQTSHRWIIQGAGPSTIIDAGQLQDRVFQIVNPGTQVVFQDLVIQGGLGQDDGSNGALAGTTDALGGGLLNNGGDVTLDNVVVQNNVARGGDVASLGVAGHNANGGGIYSAGGALTIAGATLGNNQASGGRGGNHNGIMRAGDGGSAAGGGLYASGGTLDISNSMI